MGYAKLVMFVAVCGATPPTTVPIWRGALTPTSLTGNGRLYLSEDLRSAIVLKKKEDGREKNFIPTEIPLNLQFKPIIRAHVKPTGGSNVYEYSVSNSEASHDPICAITLVVPTEQETHSARFAKGIYLDWTGGYKPNCQTE